MRIYLCIVIVFLNTFSYSQQKTTLYPFKDVISGQYGYINNVGKVIIKPTFDHAEVFNEGVGIISKPKLDRNSGFEDPSDDARGIINAQGKVIFYSKFFEDNNFLSELSKFHDGLCAFSTLVKNGKSDHGNRLWGFLDSNAQIVIKPKYHYVSDFHNGFANAVRIDGEKKIFLLIDKLGKEYDIIPDIPSKYEYDSYDNFADFFTNVSTFSDGLIGVKFANKKWGFINLKGEIIIKPIIDESGIKSIEVGAYVYSGPYFQNGKCIAFINDELCIIDTNGRIVKKLSNDGQISLFHEGISIFEVQCLRTISSGNIEKQIQFKGLRAINSDGDILFELENVHGRDFLFSDGLCSLHDGVYVDTTGKIVLDLSDKQYKKYGDFINGVAPIYKDGYDDINLIYINKKGEIIFEQ